MSLAELGLDGRTNSQFAPLETISEAELAARDADYAAGREIGRRMQNPSAIALDLDKVQLDKGQIPMTPDGHLDIYALNEQSPLTIPILREQNDLKLRGILGSTITGKSATFLLLADFETKMFYQMAGERGMLEQDYVIQPNSSGILFSKEIRIKPEFVEPKTGRMRAGRQDEQGNWIPTQNRLALNLYSVDNGGTTFEAHPDGHIHSEKFRRNLLFLLNNQEFVDLLADSTRQQKLDRQESLRDVHYSIQTINEQYLDSKYLRQLTNYELWQRAVAKVFSFSYASPHKTKFNLELDPIKIRSDEHLTRRWTKLLQKITKDKTRIIDSDEALVETLRLLFEGKAEVTLNYVHESGNNTSMGARVVIDLNPVGTNKQTGFEHMAKEAAALYKKAGLPIPDFENDSLTGGDGPDKNDKQLIQRAGGVTNYQQYHSKNEGYPVDIMRILTHFNISVHPWEKLEDLEQTYLFLRLVQHESYGRPLNDLPPSIQKKIIVSPRLLQ